MRRLHWSLFAILIPAFLTLGLTLGCGGGTEKKASDGGEKKDSGAVAKTGDGASKPIEIKSRGTLKGKVTLAGGKPDVSQANAGLVALMEKHKDSAMCLAGSEEEKSQQDWKVGEGNGLAEVFVWLSPPGSGQSYKLENVDLEVKDVTIDQPHCAFVPHVLAIFPSYNDGKAQKPTGQKLIVKNSAPNPHNTKWEGGARNRGDNKTIAPGEQIEITNLRPSDQPINFKCDMHTWMNAYVRAFDHPFVAITDKDGNFEIKNAPAGVDLQVVAWHPAAGYLAGEKGEKINLKDGENTKNFEATKK